MKKLSFCSMCQPSSFGDDHAVPEARDREQLGDALEEAQDDRLPVRRSPARGPRPGREPGEGEHRETDDERGDPVLRVVMAGAGLVAGKKPGSDFAGSAQ